MVLWSVGAMVGGQLVKWLVVGVSYFQWSVYISDNGRWSVA